MPTLEKPAKARLRILLLLGAGVGVLLLGYLLLYGLGYSIPCPIYGLTGLLCPGCGITRMLQALLRLDFSAAWQAQPVILLSLPPLIFLLGNWAVSYVRTGKVAPAKWHRWTLIILLAALLIFTVLRNLPGLDGLRPPQSGV